MILVYIDLMKQEFFFFFIMAKKKQRESVWIKSTGEGKNKREKITARGKGSQAPLTV